MFGPSESLHSASSENELAATRRGPDTDGTRAITAEKIHAIGLRFFPLAHINRLDAPVRPMREVVLRLAALNGICLRASRGGDMANQDDVAALLARPDVAAMLTGDDRIIAGKSREDALRDHQDAVGWKMENLGALAWVLGFSWGEESLTVSPPMMGGDKLIVLSLLFAPTACDELDAMLAAADGHAALAASAAADNLHPDTAGADVPVGESLSREFPEGRLGLWFEGDCGISYVTRGSAAAARGVRAGDKLVAIAGRAFAEFGDIGAFMDALRITPRPVLLTFVRGGAAVRPGSTPRERLVLKPRPAADIVRFEDLFRCLHNSARSASLGRMRQPRSWSFATPGIVHEIRHALTWLLSPGTAWEDTDLST